MKKITDINYLHLGGRYDEGLLDRTKSRLMGAVNVGRGLFRKVSTGRSDMSSVAPRTKYGGAGGKIKLKSGFKASAAQTRIDKFIDSFESLYEDFVNDMEKLGVYNYPNSKEFFASINSNADRFNNALLRLSRFFRDVEVSSGTADYGSVDRSIRFSRMAGSK